MNKLSNAEIGILQRMEKKATYSALRNPLSMEQMIIADKGRNFSTILSQEDLIVPSCSALNIPKVDAMLVWGESLSITICAAEAALRHREKYGVYPDFLTCGGAFAGGWLQGENKAECYENIMLELGFEPDWVMRHHTKARIRLTDKLNAAVVNIPHQGKLKVLAITAVGCSLLAAQTIVPIFPQIEFCFWETPSIRPEKRYLDSDVLGPSGYAVDMIIGNIVRSRMMKYPDGLRLSVESRVDLPGKDELLYFISYGYAMCCNEPKIWKYFGVKTELGMKISSQRNASLCAKVRDAKIERQKIIKLVETTKQDLLDLGLL